MKFRFTLLIIANFSLPLSSQTVIDSLYDVYNNGDSTLDKIDAGQELVWQLLNSDRKQSKDIFTDQFNLITKSDYTIQKIIAYRQASIFAGRDLNPDKAILYGDSAKTILDLQKSNLSDYDYKFWMSSIEYGNGTYYGNDYENAIASYLAAIKYAEEINDYARIANSNQNIGLIYYLSSNYPEAIIKYKEALDIAIKQEIVSTENKSYQFLGYTYKEMDSLELAKQNFLKTIDYAKEVNDLVMLQESYLGVAGVLEDQNNLDSSFYYLNLSLNETQELEYPLGESQQYLSLARVLRRLGDKKGARLNFEKFNAINKELDEPVLDEQYLRQLSELEYDVGNYQKAYDLLFEGSELHDSLNSLDHQKLIQSLEVEYETQKKVVEIKEKEILLQEERSAKKLLLVSSILLGFLLVSIYFFFRSKLITSKKLAAQESLLSEQKINQLQKEKKLLAMNAMLEGQEAERIRIAKDLHDGLGGLLSTVKARLSNITNEVKKIESYNIYEKTTSLVDEACDEVRRISHNLIPGALRLEGLKGAVQVLAAELEESHNLKVNQEIFGFTDAMDETKEVFLFRIIQEAINNIIKHAGANNVLMQLSENEQEYHVIIEDDGSGFDTTGDSSGLGLKSIRSRVDHLKGELDISSKIGEGTTISIQIPKTT